MTDPRATLREDGRIVSEMFARQTDERHAKRRLARLARIVAEPTVQELQALIDAHSKYQSVNDLLSALASLAVSSTAEEEKKT